MYPNLVMDVSEAFKVERSRIAHIDSIGLLEPGFEHTTGFGTHELRNDSLRPLSADPERKR